MRNRRGASWTLDTAPWAPARAASNVTARLADWGLTAATSLDQVVRLLTATVIADGGRRISIHLSEQNGMALVLCLSHRHADTGEAADLLIGLRDLGADSCGIETTAEGRHVWALMPAHPCVSSGAERCAPPQPPGYGR
ncbi:hypothetical protein ACF1BE_31405 [Streptomyces sp. NPDC014991]|uniref:hypothetical protein n=1 Tax=Streptomyces sp. NPDC014991 TaxID=3364935 RepID=UPI003702D520